jgi:hypothetical protein
LKVLFENISPDLSETQKQEFKELLIEYQDIFVGPDGKIGRTHLAEHTIDTGQAKPIKVPQRKYSLHQREVIETEVDKMLDDGIIRPSHSAWSSPICLVRKPDNTYRFAIDFRCLNSVTIKDSYPLPNINLIFDTLAGSRYFNTIDMASGYWQVPMNQSDRCKTAFSTPTRGLMEFNVLPFGLCNAGATFERLVEKILYGLQWHKCLCYLDDVIIYGPDFQTTLLNLREVFHRMRHANVKLKASKCKFFQKQCNFLGHVVSEQGISCDDRKIEAITNWERPSTKKGVKSFLGIVNYYRPYINQCAEIAFPLVQLTKKKTRFHWDEICETAFQTLKGKLTKAPILAYPTRHGKFILETDASAYGIAGILSQEQNGREVVIAYTSKTLSNSEMNYCTTMRELLAVLHSVRHFRHYLMGRHFEIRTDHASLVWLKNFKDADGMLSRWLSILYTFDFSISHRKGTQMKHVDALSRSVKRKCKHGQCVDCGNKLDLVKDSSQTQDFGDKKQSTTSGADAPVSGTRLETNADLKSVNTISRSGKKLCSFEIDSPFSNKLWLDIT